MQDYNTIITTAETEQVIKKSRFISRVYHVEDEAQADAILSKVRKEHYKATHVCSAYLLSTDPPRQKASDDGEPSGTAGKPILDVIAENDLKDVLVVVIRYFGGVKLGAGGLIRAYAGGAAAVLKAAAIIRKQWSDSVTITIPYPLYGGLKQKLLSSGKAYAEPTQERFTDTVTLDFKIPVAETENFLSFMTDATDGKAEHALGEPGWVDVLVRKAE